VIGRRNQEECANPLDDGALILHGMAAGTVGWSPERAASKRGLSLIPPPGQPAGTQILIMGSLKKRRKAKINKHKRRKKLRAHRHKKRTWQK
jgi:hypothetical protein